MFKVGDLIKPKQSFSDGWEESRSEGLGIVIEKTDSNNNHYALWTVHWMMIDMKTSYKFYEWQYFDLVSKAEI